MPIGKPVYQFLEKLDLSTPVRSHVPAEPFHPGHITD